MIYIRMKSANDSKKNTRSNRKKLTHENTRDLKLCSQQKKVKHSSRYRE